MKVSLSQSMEENPNFPIQSVFGLKIAVNMQQL
jgi:hypothetical protein